MPLNLCGHATLLAKLIRHAFNTCYKKNFRQNNSMNYCHHITFFMHFSIVHVNILFNWEKNLHAITFDNFRLIVKDLSLEIFEFYEKKNE